MPKISKKADTIAVQYSAPDNAPEPKTKKTINTSEADLSAQNLADEELYSFKGKKCKEWHSLFNDRRANSEDKYRAACTILDISPEALQALPEDKQKALITKAFRNLSLKDHWHPDKMHLSDRPVAESVAGFKLINAASSVLTDFATRGYKLGSSMPEDDAGDALRRRREAMRPKQEAPEPEKPAEEPPTHKEHYSSELLEQYINEAKDLLLRQGMSPQNKATIQFWLMNATKQSQGPVDLERRIDEFNSWKFRKPEPTPKPQADPSAEPAPRKPSSAHTQSTSRAPSTANEDPRSKVLALLIAEQERLMTTYHLEPATKKTHANEVVLWTIVSFDEKRDRPFHSEDSTTAKISMDRIYEIGVLAQKLQKSLKNKPGEDPNMSAGKIHEELKELRGKMKSTGLGFMVTGRNNITRAMQEVLPPKTEKGNVLEKIRQSVFKR